MISWAKKCGDIFVHFAVTGLTSTLKPNVVRLPFRSYLPSDKSMQPDKIFCLVSPGSIIQIALVNEICQSDSSLIFPIVHKEGITGNYIIWNNFDGWIFVQPWWDASAIVNNLYLWPSETHILNNLLKKVLENILSAILYCNKLVSSSTWATFSYKFSCYFRLLEYH